MAARYGLLGWKHPRPNDYQGPDQRPLRDTFASLQQNMTWPHFGASIDNQSNSNAFIKRTITPFDDPYQLIRSDDTIQVPRDFQTWMFIGVCFCITDVTGPTRGLLSWYVSGTELVGDENHCPAGTIDCRVSAVGMTPVQRGQTIEIRALSSAGGTISSGSAWGMFLPMSGT